MENSNSKIVKGFSKLSKEAKMEWLVANYLDGDTSKIDFLKSYW
ncbi:MAG: hydroxymethylglutaryl-CoA reductase, partial [Flavobacteriales bacterium]